MVSRSQTRIMFESEHINYKGYRDAPGDTNPIAIHLNEIDHGSNVALHRCAVADRQNAKAHAGAFVHVRPVTAISIRRTINPALSGTKTVVFRLALPPWFVTVRQRPESSRPPPAKPKAHHGQQITDTYHVRKRAHQL